MALARRARERHTAVALLQRNMAPGRLAFKLCEKLQIPRAQCGAAWVNANCVFVQACATLFALLAVYLYFRNARRDAAAKASLKTISTLTVYPVKGCRGVAVQTWPTDRRGLVLDRYWMVVAPAPPPEEGAAPAAPGAPPLVFQTQRELPELALLTTAVALEGASAGVLRLGASGRIAKRAKKGDLEVAVPQRLLSGESAAQAEADSYGDAALVQCQVWDDVCTCVDEGDAAAVWLSAALATPGLRLVRNSEAFERRCLEGHDGGRATTTGFADTSPFLVASEASLGELNRRLKERKQPPVGMENFRPNIVVAGVEAPFSEDSWRTFHLGAHGVQFRVARPCTRCGVPNVRADGQAPAQPLLKAEPTATLRTFRSGKLAFGKGLKKVWRQRWFFGVNASQVGGGSEQVVSVGDKVVLDEVSEAPRREWLE